MVNAHARGACHETDGAGRTPRSRAASGSSRPAPPARDRRCAISGRAPASSSGHAGPPRPSWPGARAPAPAAGSWPPRPRAPRRSRCRASSRVSATASAYRASYSVADLVEPGRGHLRPAGSSTSAPELLPGVLGEVAQPVGQHDVVPGQLGAAHAGVEELVELGPVLVERRGRGRAGRRPGRGRCASRRAGRRSGGTPAVAPRRAALGDQRDVEPGGGVGGLLDPALSSSRRPCAPGEVLRADHLGRVPERGEDPQVAAGRAGGAAAQVRQQPGGVRVLDDDPRLGLLAPASRASSPSTTPSPSSVGDPLLGVRAAVAGPDQRLAQQPLVELDHPARLEVALGVARRRPAPRAAARASPRSLRLPASELVPLRIDPVTRTARLSHPSRRQPSGDPAMFGLVIVSHEHGFVFMKTRKTAGTSVEIALSPVCGARRRDHAGHRGRRGAARGARRPRPRSTSSRRRWRARRSTTCRSRWSARCSAGRRFESYFSFAIERNPWDAVVSLYHWRNRDAGTGRPAGLRGVRRAPPVVETFATKNQRIYRLNGEVAVDRVLRYESLAEELADGLVRARPARRPRPARTPRPAPGRAARRTAPTTTTPPAHRVAELFAAPIARPRLRVLADCPRELRGVRVMRRERPSAPDGSVR